MVILIYGTTGELIKILPLIKAIPSSQQIRVSTEQQPKQLKELSNEAEIPNPNLKIADGRNGRDLEKISDMFVWLAGIIFRYPKIRRLIRSEIKAHGRKKVVVIVHGDTVTTVLGAIAGRLNRVQVAHIESGLRSGNWRHPFPEELDRRMVSKIAKIHFAPGDRPIVNLEKSRARGELINTEFNTVLDSLRLAKASNITLKKLGLPNKYFVVSIHRNELLARPAELATLLSAIARKAEEIACIFLDHPITKESIKNKGLDDLLNVPGIYRIGKLHYFQFISMASKADFIVTDSGGLQEESAYLGIPCLVHRLTTERDEGLGQNVVLSKYHTSVVEDFLSNPYKYKRPAISSRISPTKTILGYLKQNKFIR